MWSVYLSTFAWIQLCLVWECSDYWCLSRFTIRLEKNSVSLCQMKPCHAWKKHLRIMGIFRCCFCLVLRELQLKKINRLLDWAEIFLLTVGADQIFKSPRQNNTFGFVLSLQSPKAQRENCGGTMVMAYLNVKGSYQSCTWSAMKERFDFSNSYVSHSMWSQFQDLLLLISKSPLTTDSHPIPPHIIVLFPEVALQHLCNF